MKLNLMAGAAKKILKMTALKAQKYAPEILVGLGITGMIGGAILACKKTPKAQEIIAEHKEEREVINETELTEEEERKKVGKLYVETGLKLAKNYASSATLMLTSAACILTGFGILKGRNASLLAAYNAATQAMTAYRERVKDAVGEEKEGMIFSDAKDEKVDHVTLDENGEPKTEKQKTRIFQSDDPNKYSRWARFFDEVNNDIEWHRYGGNSQLMKEYLISRNQTWDRILHAEGVVFINDIYKDFGWPLVQDGWKYGWVDDGKTHVNFGIYSGSLSSRNFVNGYSDAILLDFNPSYIFDKFEKYQNL